MGTLNGEDLLSATITMGERGPWQADVQADVAREGARDSFAASDDGLVHVVIEHEGQRFVGTVLSFQGTFRGKRYQARVVGGAGKLATDLEARSYRSAAGVKVSLILGDILREAGEAASATITDAVLDARVPRWSRAAASASKCLDVLAKDQGLRWRVLADGTVWLGADAYEEAELDTVSLDTAPEEGAIRLAAETTGAGALGLAPGMAVNGEPILEVVHQIDSTLRTDAKTATLDRAVDALLDRKQPEIDYSRFYPARVVSQAADGTLTLEPDDPKIAGKGIDGVPIHLGVPGSLEVPEGARCDLFFEAGDPKRPRAALWANAELTMLKIGAGPEFVALASVVDANNVAIRSAFNAFVTLYDAHVHPGVATGGSSTLATVTPASPLAALDSVACTKLKTE